MYNRLCVATDGSESSLLAVRSAARLAVDLSAELLILHVIRNMKVPRELARFVKKDSLDVIRHSALAGVGNEILEHARELAAEQDLTRCRTEILEGDPAAAIVSAATSNGCDLIVVGTRGLGQVEGVLIGSISRKITSISDISVLVIK